MRGMKRGKSMRKYVITVKYTHIHAPADGIHIWDIEHGDIQVVVTRKLYPYWLVLILSLCCKGLYIPPTEERNHESFIAVNHVNCNNHMTLSIVLAQIPWKHDRSFLIKLNSVPQDEFHRGLIIRPRTHVSRQVSCLSGEHTAFTLIHGIKLTPSDFYPHMKAPHKSHQGNLYFRRRWLTLENHHWSKYME